MDGLLGISRSLTSEQSFNSSKNLSLAAYNSNLDLYVNPVLGWSMHLPLDLQALNCLGQVYAICGPRIPGSQVPCSTHVAPLLHIFGISSLRTKFLVSFQEAHTMD